jgi:hypothetical protein
MGLSWDKPSTNWCRISSIQYLMIVDDSESCVCVGVDDAVVEVGPRYAVCTCLTSLFKEGTVGFSQFCSDDQALCWWFQSLTSCFAPMRNSCPGDLGFCNVFVVFHHLWLALSLAKFPNDGWPKSSHQVKSDRDRRPGTGGTRGAKDQLPRSRSP